MHKTPCPCATRDPMGHALHALQALSSTGRAELLRQWNLRQAAYAPQPAILTENTTKELQR